MPQPNYKLMAYQAAVKHGIDPKIFLRQIQQESGFNPKAGSHAGAQGIAQIMPATARAWGVDPWNPAQALDAAAKNMSKYVRDYGGWRNALIAYNAGPGRVGKPLYDETAGYLQKILGSTNANPKALPGGAVARRGAVPVAPIGQPKLPTMPAQLNPREAARLEQMKLSTREFEPVQASEDQVRKLALAGDAAGVIRNANMNERAETEAFNQNALDYNRQLQTTMLAAKNESIRQKAMQDWLSQAGKQVQGATAQMQQPAGPGANGFFRTPNGLVRNRLGTEAPWQFLQRLGNKGFGLRNDPGDHQTTGGRHAAGSLHYDGRAIDFGNARNSEKQLDQFYSWLKPRSKTLGIQELIWRDKGHHDHLHLGIRG